MLNFFFPFFAESYFNFAQKLDPTSAFFTLSKSHEFYARDIKHGTAGIEKKKKTSERDGNILDIN